MTQEQASALISTWNIDPQVWWLFPARAFTGDILAILMWVALCAILFPLGVFIFSRSFVSDAAAAAAMGRKKRGADARVATVRGGVMGSVIRKEVRLLVRDPLLLSQIGLQVVYLLPLGFVLLRPDSGIALTGAVFVPALTLLSSALSGSLIWITVSAEDAPDLISSAPVPMRMVDQAKLSAAIAPVLALMAIPVGALLVRDTPAGLWALGGVAAASASSALDRPLAQDAWLPARLRAPPPERIGADRARPGICRDRACSDSRRWRLRPAVAVADPRDHRAGDPRGAIPSSAARLPPPLDLQRLGRKVGELAAILRHRAEQVRDLDFRHVLRHALGDFRARAAGRPCHRGTSARPCPAASHNR